MICREQVASSEKLEQGAQKKYLVLTPKLGIREHKKLSKGAQHQISGHHLLFCSLRRPHRGPWVTAATGLKATHSKPLIACLSPKGTDRLLPAGYHSMTPAWNLCTFLLIQTHPYPAYGCSRLNCLPKSEGLQHKKAMHSTCQVSAWFHPKTIPPHVPSFPS